MATVNKRVGEGPFTFAVFGDSKNNPPFWDLLRFIDRQKPDFAVTTGDLVDRGGGARGAQEYATLARSGGWFLQKYPTWPVPGNHELAGGANDARRNYERFFGFPPGRYSFRCGPATFAVLDWPTPGREATAWLERTLTAAGDGPKFVVLHDVLYTVGSKAAGNRPTPLTRLFTQHRVTAVFQGHDHGYYRTRRDGVWYITSAGAGAEIYRLRHWKSALNGDVFYGRAPTGQSFAPPGAYWLRHPHREDLIEPRPRTFAVFVTVDGSRVTVRTLAANGDEWDRFEL
jgi:3',5'-cyclic AMP phosphodiesterase CpdA